VAKQSFEECERKYQSAAAAYREYVDRRAREKFGSHVAAAKAIHRSRAHLNDCIRGDRGLDAVRRLAQKLEAAPAE